MSFLVRAPPPPGFDPTGTIGVTGSPPNDPPHDGECRLLGPFAILIQSALGALALLSLVYKRYRERPQRPIKIWAFDVSKQVVGSILLHLVNLAMSELSSGTFEVVAAATKGAQGAVDLAAAAAAGAGAGEGVAGNGNPGGNGGAAPTGEQREGMGMLAIRTLLNAGTRSAALAARQEADAARMPAGAHNPCSFYLLNLAIDTTVGIPILIVLLRLSTAAFARTPLARPPESLKTGNYGRPPRATWWLKQCLVYFVGLLGMKLCVFFIFQLCPWLGAVGDWALRWTEGDERLQIFFVMLFFPLVMNALQYYIIDGFIKEQQPGSKDAAASYEEIRQDEDEDEDGQEESSGGAVGGAEGAAAAADEEDDDGGEGIDNGHTPFQKLSGETAAAADRAYDPELHSRK